jgi:non-ribosomal peptide synthetase component E (peptide arylation enzyme)
MANFLAQLPARADDAENPVRELLPVPLPAGRASRSELVDANDIAVPPGETGELVVRTAVPWTMNATASRSSAGTRR